ncbi:hypothetical protein Acr_10g0005520 [Actinidia rufa]|uniref:Uncharacterized protein n=1 Tax=Actinidia rufa TaxID=165716 RepID=A0A7J0FB95_9ERIC|nr:hypothetical protein Acr_10g0005520 [Actinidia rufa]
MAELIRASILDHGEPPSATSSQPQQLSLTELSPIRSARQYPRYVTPLQRATPLPTEVNALPNRSACTFSLRCPAPPHQERKRLVRRRRAYRCASTLSLSSELLHEHPALVAPSCVWPDFHTFLKVSPCAPVPLRILQVHPSDIPALTLRASVQRLLSSSIFLASTTGPMSDNSSSCLDTPLQSSPSLISHLPCGTGLSFANNRVVSHPYKSLACYMCRERLSVSTQVSRSRIGATLARIGTARVCLMRDLAHARISSHADRLSWARAARGFELPPLVWRVRSVVARCRHSPGAWGRVGVRGGACWCVGQFPGAWGRVAREIQSSSTSGARGVRGSDAPNFKRLVRARFELRFGIRFGAGASSRRDEAGEPISSTSVPPSGEIGIAEAADPAVWGHHSQVGLSELRGETRNGAEIPRTNNLDLGNSWQLSVWHLPPVPYSCACCQVLREITHTNGIHVTKLEIHGRLGMICHAILENRYGGDRATRNHYQIFESVSDILRSLVCGIDNLDVDDFLQLSPPDSDSACEYHMNQPGVEIEELRLPKELPCSAEGMNREVDTEGLDMLLPSSHRQRLAKKINVCATR